MDDFTQNTDPPPGGSPSRAVLTRDMLTASLASRHNMLRGVDLEAVWPLLQGSEVISLNDATALLEPDQENHTMYMVLQGRLEVFLDRGRERQVASLEPGETVGELSVIDTSKVSAMVCARGTTIVLCIGKDTFWKLVRGSHEFSTNLLLLLSARMRNNLYSLMESQRLQSKFEAESMTDGLTGAHNRRWLDQKLDRLLVRSQGAGRDLSVLMVDVDHFKRFNDNFGHQAGDLVLRRTAASLSRRLRAQDLVVRYGGEEFCVVLPETSLEQAETLGQQLLVCVRDMEPAILDEVVLPPITVSIGAASFVRDETAAALLKRADQALYRAKHRGRNRVECAAPGS